MRPGGLLLVGTLLLGACADSTEPPPVRTAPRPATDERTSSETFVDVAAEVGIAVVQVGGSSDVDYIIDSLGPGAAWLDYDGDGDADLYLAQGATRAQPANGPPDRLLRNDAGRFTDVTGPSGLGDKRWSFGAAVADYDNDGDPDLYLANWGRNRLYRNNGDGTFDDIAPQAAVDDPRWSVSAAWGDTDLDGDLDLYVTNYIDFEFERYPARGERRKGGAPPCLWKNIEVFCGPRNLVPQADVYYRNDGDPDGDGVPDFVDATAEAGLDRVEPRFALDARFFDIDDDGDPDLYVANDSVRNTLFVNDGSGRFEENAVFAGVAFNEQGEEQAGMGLAVADYDLDRDLDLFVTNFSHDHDTLYRNDGGLSFTDASYPAGIGGPSFFTLAWGAAFGDFDHDGWEDLYVAHGHVYPQVDSREIGTKFRQPDALFRNLGDGRFLESGAQAGAALRTAKSSRAVLPLDLEPDGDLDLLVTHLGAAPDLLRNDGAAGNWFQLRLSGTLSNRDGIGARVVLEAGGRTQTREITRSSSYAGSTLPVAHFGLGSAVRVDRLDVRWPSGRTTTQYDLEPNRAILVREDPLGMDRESGAGSSPPEVAPGPVSP